jgi:hypothetical protein
VVIGDDLAAASSAEETWPAVLASRLADAGTPLDARQVTDAVGFAPDGAAARSFAEAVLDSVDPATQLVVFWQSGFGSAAAADVGRGAAEAFRAVEQAAPDALIVVIAPWFGTSSEPSPTREVSDAVRSAAEGAEVAVTYVDPVAESWPTGLDAQQFTDLLFPEVAPLISALGRSGAFD